MIEIFGVSKSYQRKLVLNNVSTRIPQGEITGLLGPNGAGKTTLIRIINQMLAPNSGYIKFDGQLLNHSHLRHMGYLPEERGLYKSMTVKDQLLFLCRLRGMSKVNSINNIEFWLDKFDISTWKGHKIDSLSKGMAQKIQFISTIVHDPEFIVLDEPLSGFDPINVELIMKELRDLRDAGKTILLSTHNMQNVQDMCSNILLLNEGNKIADASYTAICSANASNEFIVKFRGTKIGFANALWTDFELLNQEEFEDGCFEARLLMRGEKSVDDLINNIRGHVQIESVKMREPNMQEIFMDLVHKNKEEL